jgi:hypothetical protein
MRDKNKHHLNDLSLYTSLNTEGLNAFSGEIEGGETFNSQIMINGQAFLSSTGTTIYTGSVSLAAQASVLATAVA